MWKGLLIFCLMLYNVAIAQVRDSHWITGGPSHLIRLNDTGIVDITKVMDIGPPRPIFADGSSCISDEKGNIALMCNGYFLYDTSGTVIENGDSLVPTKLIKRYSGFSGYIQQSIILPKKDNLYYVFTATMSDGMFDKWQLGENFTFDMLTYHVVEAYGGGAGKGKVLEKGNVLMKDARLSHNRMTAVKHANGRDWWLVKPHKKEQIFYTFLVTPKGISGPYEQNMHLPPVDFPNDNQSSVFGSSVFSRDGRFYAHTVAEAGVVFVNEFDRCTGKFTEYFTYDIPSGLDSLREADFTYGVAFSPDSKLLYASTAFNVFQIDLADKSNNSVQFIHGPDTLPVRYFTRYLFIQLGIDDKLYLGNKHGIFKTMSFIKKPNIRGVGCEFCAKCFSPGFYMGAPTNMPYYALGPQEGPCDTLREPTTELVLPNAFTPNGDGLNDTWHILNKNSLLADNVSVEACGVYNRWGNRVFTANNIGFSWNGKSLAMGTYIYFIRYRLANGETKVKKGEINLIR